MKLARTPAQRRMEHRGILLACALAGAAVAASWGVDSVTARNGEWLWFAITFIGLLQLAYIVPLAMAAALRRPGSGLARGLVLGAAITGILSAGYCCQSSQKKPASRPAPASRPVAKAGVPVEDVVVHSGERSR